MLVNIKIAILMNHTQNLMLQKYFCRNPRDIILSSNFHELYAWFLRKNFLYVKSIKRKFKDEIASQCRKIPKLIFVRFFLFTGVSIQIYDTQQWWQKRELTVEILPKNYAVECSIKLAKLLHFICIYGSTVGEKVKLKYRVRLCTCVL
jgi:hypothetical protein